LESRALADSELATLAGIQGIGGSSACFGLTNQSSARARQLIQSFIVHQKMSKADAILGVSLLLLGVGGVALVNEGLRQQQVQRKLEYQRLDEQGLSKEDITHCSNKLPGPRVDRN
jgi:hypothetical protein